MQIQDIAEPDIKNIQQTNNYKNKKIPKKAIKMNWKDFEDAIQNATAEQIRANYIITRNVRDFTKSKILAFTPSELLEQI